MIDILGNIIAPFLISAFASDFATGPVTFLVFRNALLGKYGKSFALIFGSAIMEMIYCAVALIFIGAILSQGTRIKIFSEAVSFVIFFIIGIYLFKTNPNKRQSVELGGISTKEKTQSFLTGFILTALNPTIILTWSAAVAVLLSIDLLVISSYFDVILFTLAAGLGTITGTIIMIFLVHHFRLKFSERVIRFILRIIGIVLIGLSIYFFYNFIKMFLV